MITNTVIDFKECVAFNAMDFNINFAYYIMGLNEKRFFTLNTKSENERSVSYNYKENIALHKRFKSHKNR